MVEILYFTMNNKKQFESNLKENLRLMLYIH